MKIAVKIAMKIAVKIAMKIDNLYCISLFKQDDKMIYTARTVFS